MSTTNPYGASSDLGNRPIESLVAKAMVIKRIDPISLGKLNGGICALLGLLWGAMTAIFTIIGVSSSSSGFSVSGMGWIAILSVLFFPVGLAIFGFIGGAIGALVFNIGTGVFGGLRIDVEVKDNGF